MSNGEILNKAMEKAYENGWQTSLGKYETDSSGKLLFRSSIGDFEPLSIYQVIYDHGFAKALWGNSAHAESYRNDLEHGYSFAPAWILHLQHMIVANDPVQYLGEHLNG